MEKFDLSAIRGKWLSQCGSCDAGLPMNCTCPDDDPRSVILTLVNHLEDLYSNFDLLLCSTMGEAVDRLEQLQEAQDVLREIRTLAERESHHSQFVTDVIALTPPRLVAGSRVAKALALLNDREVEWCCSCPADLHRIEKVLNPDA